jgi:hypothetical protein
MAESIIFSKSSFSADGDEGEGRPEAEEEAWDSCAAKNL